MRNINKLSNKMKINYSNTMFNWYKYINKYKYKRQTSTELLPKINKYNKVKVHYYRNNDMKDISTDYKNEHQKINTIYD